MSDYKKPSKISEGLGMLAEGYSVSKTVVVSLFWIAIAVIVIGGPSYFAWTYRGELEEAARKDVIVTPLQYKRTMMSFPSMGYKIVLERITEEKNLSLAEVVYRTNLLEQQMMAHTSAVNMKARALEKEKQQLQALEEQKQEKRSKKLVQEVGDALQISDEDREGLNDILTGVN